MFLSCLGIVSSPHTTLRLYCIVHRSCGLTMRMGFLFFSIFRKSFQVFFRLLLKISSLPCSFSWGLWCCRSSLCTCMILRRLFSYLALLLPSLFIFDQLFEHYKIETFWWSYKSCFRNFVIDYSFLYYFGILFPNWLVIFVFFLGHPGCRF